MKLHYPEPTEQHNGARVIVTRDGKPVAVVDDENAAFAWVLGHQGQSVEWACHYEGYAWGYAQPWPEDAADDDPHGYKTAGFLRRMAPQMFRHDHPGYIADKEERELTRENCSACVLGGYEPKGGWEPGASVKRDGPNYAGWARIYVEARRSIPAKWRDAFERERHSDNEAYAAALERSIATFGVRFQ